VSLPTTSRPHGPAALVTRLFEIMAGGELSDFRAVVHPSASNREARIEPPACRTGGPDAWYATSRWLRNMAPDVRWEIHEVIAERHLVAAHCTMSGHHTGEHAHYDADGRIAQVMPPTGLPFSTTQSHWFRVVDGLLGEHWANRDDLAMGLQLGWWGRPT
jgi:predicted ester cyclase